MTEIKEVKVVVQPTSEKFHDELMWCVHHFQEQGLEVTINNPSMIVTQDTHTVGGPTFTAVVEGHIETEADEYPVPEFESSGNPFSENSKFPSFNIKPKSQED